MHWIFSLQRTEIQNEKLERRLHPKVILPILCDRILCNLHIRRGHTKRGLPQNCIPTKCSTKWIKVWSNEKLLSFLTSSHYSNQSAKWHFPRLGTSCIRGGMSSSLTEWLSSVFREVESATVSKRDIFFEFQVVTSQIQFPRSENHFLISKCLYR
jgi:hypothetical protein